FYSQGITNRSETETLSAYGRLLKTSIGSALQVRPLYGLDGKQRAIQTLGPPPPGQNIEKILRMESEFAWQDGGRAATVEVFANGTLLDRFVQVNDEDGRVMTNHWH